MLKWKFEEAAEVFFHAAVPLFLAVQSFQLAVVIVQLAQVLEVG